MNTRIQFVRCDSSISPQSLLANGNVRLWVLWLCVAYSSLSHAPYLNFHFVWFAWHFCAHNLAVRIVQLTADKTSPLNLSFDKRIVWFDLFRIFAFDTWRFVIYNSVKAPVNFVVCFRLHTNPRCNVVGDFRGIVRENVRSLARTYVCRCLYQITYVIFLFSRGIRKLWSETAQYLTYRHHTYALQRFT